MEGTTLLTTAIAQFRDLPLFGCTTYSRKTVSQYQVPELQSCYIWITCNGLIKDRSSFSLLWSLVWTNCSKKKGGWPGFNLEASMRIADPSIGKVLDEILDLLVVDGMDVVDVVGAHILEGTEGGFDMIGSRGRWWLGVWENKVIQAKFLDWCEYNIIMLY